MIPLLLYGNKGGRDNCNTNWSTTINQLGQEWGEHGIPQKNDIEKLIARISEKGQMAIYYQNVIGSNNSPKFLNKIFQS